MKTMTLKTNNHHGRVSQPFRDDVFQEKLNILQNMIVDRFEEVIEEFSLCLRESSNLYLGACPIHNGNNYQAFNFYKDGTDVPGYWVCNTHQCHNLYYDDKKVFAKNSLGLVRALLSVRECDWSTPGDDTYPFGETIKFVEKLFGVKLDDYKVSQQDIQKKKLLMEGNLYKQRDDTGIHLDIGAVKGKLIIPDPYFVQRGFSPGVLRRFHVGFCDNPKSPMYRRSVCPILDEAGKSVVGLTGRTNSPLCSRCNCYHDEGGTCGYRKGYEKWSNTGSFKSSSLYNYWSAKDFIRESKVAVLVEGQGDVWRLVENGVENVVGLFGTYLSDEQQFLLEKAGAMGIIVMLDNPAIDQAGKTGTTNIIKKCGQIFRVFTNSGVYRDKKDVGDFEADQIALLKEFIKKIENIYKG